MTESNLTISVEPIGPDRYSIRISKGARVINELRGNEDAGFTEADLRDAMGLPKCGLNETQIDKVIALANSKRVEVDNGTPLL